MAHVLYTIGNFAARHPWRVLGAWFVVMVAMMALNGSIGGSSDDEFRLPGAESQRAADALEKRFPEQTLYTSNVVFHAENGLADPATTAAISATVHALADDPHVIGVRDPFAAGASTVSPDGTTAFATVGYDTSDVGLAEFEAAQDASRAAREAGVQVEYDGSLGYATDDDEPSSEMVGLAIAVVVLLVVFGSLVAMSLPIVTALAAILVGPSLIGILSGIIAVPQIASFDRTANARTRTPGSEGEEDATRTEMRPACCASGGAPGLMRVPQPARSLLGAI